MAGEPTHTEAKALSRSTAAKFAQRWMHETDEKQQAQHFWQDFFRDVCEVTDLKAAGIEFEKRVTSSKKGTTTFIDVFWKDTFLAEHKSAGKDLDAAEAQAREYVVSLPPALRPPVVIVSDFARFRIVDILLNKTVEFPLDKLPDHLDRIESIVGRTTKGLTDVQVEADQKAAQLMADLYVQLEKNGYEGHQASVFMVRILFCLFADDTRMWESDIFEKLVKDTNPLGTDLGPRLSALFEILDTPRDQRPSMIDPLTSRFPYVNGGIFSEKLPVVYFNTTMRNALLNCCAYDWSGINPTIFGSLFQDIKSKDERRANGEHYTTEENIDKTIGPLFIEALHKKLESAWDNEGKLKELQRELGTFQILDPACGCGNFLITAYKRLRQLELDILVRLKQLAGNQTSLFGISDDMHVSLEQLHGIEYVEWSSQIAQVAVYLADHQENLKLETVLGVAANRFPLSHSAKIVQGNALQLDWTDLCEIGDRTIIVGNPPFKGSNRQSAEQRSDTAAIWGSVRGAGSVDYVSNWYLKAARYISNTKAKAAFVSTNSITQGEQPYILWGELYKLGIDIDFAHRTFEWSSDAHGKASVHCVIIGFSSSNQVTSKRLWHYETPKSKPTIATVSAINAYLYGGAKALIAPRKKPISTSTPPMRYGNMPNEFGYLANLTSEDVDLLAKSSDPAIKYIRPLIGASELLNNEKRFCLWLVRATPDDMSKSPFISNRIEMVRKLRSESQRPATRKLAATPFLFQEVREQVVSYLAVPIVSSENREYIPMKMVEPLTIPTNRLLTIPDCPKYIFSILQSKVFSLWCMAISGRLKNDFSLSAEITYNNFPFPEISPELRKALEESADLITSARDEFIDTSLAVLYKPTHMPLALRKVHEQNDKLVLSCFGLDSKASDSDVLSALFNVYELLTKGD